MLEAVQSPWCKPSLIPISTKRLDHMYRAQEESAPFLFTHPSPNSLVVSSSSKERWQHSSPQDKEDMKLDSFKWCLYSAGTLGIKASNYMACIARFIYAILVHMTPYLQNLADDQRTHVLHLHADGLAAARQKTTSTKHTLEMAAKTYYGGGTSTSLLASIH